MRSRKTFTAWCQNWLERDRWSGPSDDGISLHLTPEDHLKFVKKVYKGREGTPVVDVPECYSSAESRPFLIRISDAVHRKLTAAKKKRRCGVRSYVCRTTAEKAAKCVSHFDFIEAI